MFVYVCVCTAWPVTKPQEKSQFWLGKKSQGKVKIISCWSVIRLSMSLGHFPSLWVLPATEIHKSIKPLKNFF